MKIRVGIMDSTPLDGYELPVGNMFGASPSENPEHANMVADEFIDSYIQEGNEEIDLEIFGLKYTQASWHWMKEQNKSEETRIHILILSMSDWNHTTQFGGEHLYLEEIVGKKTILMTSAGNIGKKGETNAALREIWVSVGAVDQHGNRRSYSSFGNGAIDISAQDGFNARYGTSYANPRAAGKLADFMRRFFNEKGYFPETRISRAWLFANGTNEEYDLETGFGILEIPDYSVYDVDVLTPYQPRMLMSKGDDNHPVNVNKLDKERIRMLKRKGFYKIGDYTNPSAI